MDEFFIYRVSQKVLDRNLAEKKTLKKCGKKKKKKFVRIVYILAKISLKFNDFFSDFQAANLPYHSLLVLV